MTEIPFEREETDEAIIDRVRLPRPWEVAGTSDPILPDDHPIMQQMAKVMRPMDPNAKLPSFADIGTPPDRLDMPRLWDLTPETITHIAGACIILFNRYMRQRCDWCGIVLLEYDIARVAVPEGQDPTPAHWIPGTLVRADGNMQADIIEQPPLGSEIRPEKNGETQLPPDSCAFDPKTQVK